MVELLHNSRRNLVCIGGLAWLLSLVVACVIGCRRNYVRLMQLRHQGWTIGARREPRERVRTPDERT